MCGPAFFLRSRLLAPYTGLALLSFLAVTTLVSVGCFEGRAGEGLMQPSIVEFDSTFVFAYPDFNADSQHPVEPPPPERQIGSLLYRAQVIPEDTSLDSDGMFLWITVRVRNPTDQTVELPVQECPVQPEVYPLPSRSGEPVWAPGGQCAQQPYSVRLAPGTTEEFSYLMYDAMFSTSIPDGRYYFTALFQHADGTIALPAGSGDVRLRVPGLAYRVRLRSEGPYMHRAEVTVTNRNRRRVRLTYGHCALSIKLYRDQDRRELLSAGDPDRSCPRYLALGTLDPGESALPDQFVYSFSLPERLPGRLQQGRYFVSVSLDHNSPTYEFPAGSVTLHWQER